MQIGFNLPISGPLAEPETVIRLAQEGEALGYDYLTLPRYRSGIARLRRFAGEAGRDPAEIALAYRVKRYGEAVPEIDFERPEAAVPISEMRRFKEEIISRI